MNLGTFSVKRPRSRPKWTIRQSRSSILWGLLLSSTFFFSSSFLLSSTSLSFQHRLSGETDPVRRYDLANVVISIASTEDRLHNELPMTLRSVFRQTVQPREIAVFLPLETRERIRGRMIRTEPKLQEGMASKATPAEASELLLLPSELRHTLVKVWFVPDRGPATKFLYTLQNLTALACKTSAINANPRTTMDVLRTPVIVCEDHHYYFPTMVETLIRASWRVPLCSAVGFRGWRIRVDLQWGVLGSKEFKHHVIEGERVRLPYQVGVLTANRGYLVKPFFFLEESGCAHPERLSIKTGLQGRIGINKVVTGACSTAPVLGPIAIKERYNDTVDDVWLSGSLASLHVARFVVPSPSKNVDIHISHTLETRITKSEVARAQAMTTSLQQFQGKWEKGIWYQFGGANGPDPGSLASSIKVLFLTLKLVLASWADYLIWLLIPHTT